MNFKHFFTRKTSRQAREDYALQVMNQAVATGVQTMLQGVETMQGEQLPEPLRSAWITKLYHAGDQLNRNLIKDLTPSELEVVIQLNENPQLSAKLQHHQVLAAQMGQVTMMEALEEITEDVAPLGL